MYGYGLLFYSARGDERVDARRRRRSTTVDDDDDDAPFVFFFLFGAKNDAIDGETRSLATGVARLDSFIHHRHSPPYLRTASIVKEKTSTKLNAHTSRRADVGC